MATQLVLYVQPDEIVQALGPSVNDTVERFFSISQNDTRFGVLKELLENLRIFCEEKITPAGTCALLTCLVDIHMFCVTRAELDLSELTSFVTDRIASYGLELPPLYTSCLSQREIDMSGPFFEEYLRNFKLYRYLFKPQNILKVRTTAENIPLQVESTTQLGTQIPALGEKPKPPQPNEEKAAKEKEKKLLRPFNVTVHPLSAATLYVKPPEPTVQEARAEQIKQEVAQIAQKVEEQQKPMQAGEQVEEFNHVIELQVQQELEKVRARIMAEMSQKKK